MTIELLGVIVLSFVLAVVLFAYDRQLREIKKLRKNRQTVEEQARQKAEELVHGARNKAVEIIGEAKVDATKWEQLLDQELDTLMKEQLGEYKESLQTITNQITNEVKGETDGFKKVLEMETVEQQKLLADQIKAEYTKVEQEIEVYKQKRLQQIEEQSLVTLKDVCRKLIGKTLDFNDHVELIKEALNEAKKQNVI